HSAAEMRAKNPEEFNADMAGKRYKAEGEIYIFSVARRDFDVICPPLFPKVHLRGCSNGERYVLAASVADPVPQASPDLERGGKRWDYHDGWQSAIGLLNPESSSRDPFIG